MKKNLTLEQREALPNKTRCVLQPDGLWTVYEVGDVLPELPAPMIVPEVTRFQFKLALAQAGLLASIEAYIAGSSDDTLRLYWAEAPTFRRDHPILAAAAVLLGKTEAEIDAVFALALTL
jgi:hypothetical protein